MDTETLYWVWLQTAIGVTAHLRTQEVLAAFPTARAIFEASDMERRMAGVFTPRMLARMQNLPLHAAEAICAFHARPGFSLLHPQSQAYPERLRQIHNFPLVLYVRGSVDCLAAHLPVAVVGTRRPARKSVDIASRLSSALSQAGCVVVSGAALGIDSAAHWGALHEDAPTVAVLGCGLAARYLPENADLRRRICEKGALVTEFPTDTAPRASTFPVRNRLIAGICVGTVVVEASEKSGSLITANCANEQGRDVFAVPGDVFGSTYTGGNKLIREGAKPVFSAVDVLEDYEVLYPHLLQMHKLPRDLEQPTVQPDAVPTKPARKAGAAKPTHAATPQPTASSACPTEAPMRQVVLPAGLEGRVFALLQRGAMHIDGICKQVDAPFGALFAALMQLEMQGLVRQTPGKNYEIAEGIRFG